MSDRQCSSCGGICGRGGCKRENVNQEDESISEGFWMSKELMADYLDLIVWAIRSGDVRELSDRANWLRMGEA